jgi:hypothetical protein
MSAKPTSAKPTSAKPTSAKPMSAKRALSGVRAPDEPGAEERAWAVVRAAHRQRAPARARRPYRRAMGALAAAVGLAGAAALSPAGATVVRLIDRALGVQHATPAPLALPAPGRVLVAGTAGTWTVRADGSTRRIGPWSQASWSPHGLYLTVVGADRLVAVTPRGIPQWALARPGVSDPRWYAPTGYRVAYLSGSDLRVVAGNGQGDHLLAARVARVAPAWRPDHPYQLAYVSAVGRLAVRDGDTGAAMWSARPAAPIRQLAWSADGARLLVLSPRRALVYSAGGRLLRTLTPPDGAPLTAAALSPDGRRLALLTGGGDGAVDVYSLVARDPAARRVLAAAGLGQVAWSPDGSWLLISWPAADQWIFARVVGSPRIAAVSRISQRFSHRAHARFPVLEGWCCATTGAVG